MNPEDEFDNYVSETANLPLFASDRSDYFSPHHRFMLDALGLVRDCWPIQGTAWYEIAVACAEERIAREVVHACRLETVAYWKAQVARPFGDVQTQHEAVVVMFHCALKHREDSGRLQNSPPLLMQAIDFFAETFINQFGRSNELIALLRQAFDVAPDSTHAIGRTD